MEQSGQGNTLGTATPVTPVMNDAFAQAVAAEATATTAGAAPAVIEATEATTEVVPEQTVTESAPVATDASVKVENATPNIEMAPALNLGEATEGATGGETAAVATATDTVAGATEVATVGAPAASAIPAASATPVVPNDFSQRAENVNKMPASKIRIEFLLEECIKTNASDLHLQIGLPPILRVDGALRRLGAYEDLDAETVERLVFSTLEDDQKEILLKDKEFDYSFAFGDLGRFRVNAFFERGNLAAACRLIPNKIPKISEIGIPPVVESFADYPRGLVLVTGPTGSGKSTTLAALIDKINQERATHIISIEDPIEYAHKSKRSVVVQREVHYDTFSFSAALRSALREDPDVVLIGEMRDLETISSAITIAETGHLVFATLHTNSAAQSIDRMIDVFPPHQQPQVRSQLSNILMAICAQRLVPAIGGGRVVAAEIMTATPAVRSVIREGKTHQLDTIIQTSADQGMQTMDRTLAKMVQAGQITYDSAREFAVDLAEFDRLMRG